MSNFFNLIKINFSSYINLGNKNPFIATVKIIFFLGLYFTIGLFIYSFARYMINGFSNLHMEALAISEFFSLCSMLILTLNIFKTDIFNSKDHDLLSSLPISEKVILASKLLNIYLFNLLLTFMIMIPVYLAYINVVGINVNFIVKALISLFGIPIIPIVVAIFINSIITIISTRFKYKKVIQTILLIALLMISLYFGYYTSFNMELNLLDIESSLNKFFNNFYPLTKYFAGMLIDNNIKASFIFWGLSFISVIFLLLFLSIFYNKVSNKIVVSNRHLINTNKLSNHNLFVNLVKKDLKRVITSPNYLLNSCFGLFIILIIAILLLFFNLNDIQNIPITEAEFIRYLPFIFMFCILLSSTTSSLISIEGKNWYILKMLPIKFKAIWQAKVISNLIIILLASFISLIIFNCSLGISLKTNSEIIMIVLSSGLFISLYGLVINLLFPNLSWKSEIKVIKQSMSSFITVFTGIIISIILVSNKYVANDNYVLIISLGLLLFSLLLIIFLNVVGAKIYSKLNN